MLLTHGVQHEFDDHRLGAALAGYRTLLAPGSALALSGWATPADGDPLPRTVEQIWHTHSGRRIRCHSLSGLRRLFTGFDLLDPGLTPVSNWWPDGPRLHTAGAALRLGYSGVGITP